MCPQVVVETTPTKKLLNTSVTHIRPFSSVTPHVCSQMKTFPETSSTHRTFVLSLPLFFLSWIINRIEFRSSLKEALLYGQEGVLPRGDALVNRPVRQHGMFDIK